MLVAAILLRHSMRFAGPDQTHAAHAITTRWLPELVCRIEDGVCKMGLGPDVP